MVQKTVEVISLGTMADLDPDEWDSVSENSGSLVGATFGSLASPLYQQLDYLTFDDPDNDGVTYSNDFDMAPEDVIFDGVASGIDSVIEYTVDITFNDGTTSAAEIVLIQDVSGRVFLAPFLDGLAENDVLDDGGIRSIKITGIVDDTFDGAFVDREADAFVICFLEGTEIACPQGAIPVERLSVGDLVNTLDHGPQPITWIAQEKVAPGAQTLPVRFKRGALGAGLPKCDLFVSPQHRMMVRSDLTGSLVGNHEVFLPAKGMCDLPGVRQSEVNSEIIYWHVMLRRHEVLFAEGAPVESFLPGSMAIAALSRENKADLLRRWPFLRWSSTRSLPARPSLSVRQAAKLVRLHRSQKRSMLASGFPFVSDALDLSA